MYLTVLLQQGGGNAWQLAPFSLEFLECMLTSKTQDTELKIWQLKVLYNDICIKSESLIRCKSIGNTWTATGLTFLQWDQSPITMFFCKMIFNTILKFILLKTSWQSKFVQIKSDKGYQIHFEACMYWVAVSIICFQRSFTCT